MRLRSRAVMSCSRLGVEIDPKVDDSRGPISQFWAMPSWLLPYGSRPEQALPPAVMWQSHQSRPSPARNP